MPLVGRNAVVQIGVVTVGFAQGVTANMTADLIKEFQLNSDKPAILEDGNKHFKFTVDKMYIDKTYAQQVYSGTSVDLIFAPAGTSTGKEKITYKTCTFTAWDMKVDQKGIVGEKVAGEASDVLWSTF
jgi:hypothetical protein